MSTQRARKVVAGRAQGGAGPALAPGLPHSGRRENPRRMPSGVRSILYVLAKEPVPGLVKTRLCPPLRPAQAAALAAACAADTLAMAAGLAAVEVRLALAPARAGGLAARAECRDLAVEAKGRSLAVEAEGRSLAMEAAGHGLAVEDQGDGDLGARMARLMARGLRDGPTLLIGTDSPDRPASMVADAVAALQRCDAVLAPAADGGYVLVGARRPLPALFAIDAAWGSRRVMASTCDALSRAGCAFEVLAGWEDVDDARALGRLAARLEGAGADAAPETARLLARWRSEGVRF